MHNRIPRLTYANVVSTLALILAISTGGAYAAKTTGLIGSKQIRKNAITSKHIRDGSIRQRDIRQKAVGRRHLMAGAVASSAIQDGAVQTADIGEGQVTPEEVSMPAPKQIQVSDPVTTKVGLDFEPLTTIDTYIKQDAGSALQVSWTGTASAPRVSCTFQLRVDGQPSSPGAGMVFVQLGTVTSLAATALFSGLPTGPHTIEIWARSATIPDYQDPCVVGPAEAGIPQTFVVTEQVF